MVPGHSQGHRTARDAGSQVLKVQRGQRQAEHQPPTAPVGEVHMHVEVAGQQLGRVGLQISPVVLVEEPCRRDLSPRRDAPQLRHPRHRQRTVQGHELVALVLAHDTPAPFDILTTNRPRPAPRHRPGIGASQADGSTAATTSLTGRWSSTWCRLPPVETVPRVEGGPPPGVVLRSTRARAARPPGWSAAAARRGR
jgi:hypothetical protein